MSGSYLPKPEWLVLEWHRSCVSADALCIQRCASCDTWRHPPRRFCATCFGGDAAFEPVTGTGTVHSLVVSHRSLDPGWNEHTPFPTLVIELDEGPRLLAATTAAVDDVGLGTVVRCSIKAQSEDFALVWAEPVRQPRPGGRAGGPPRQPDLRQRSPISRSLTIR